MVSSRPAADGRLDARPSAHPAGEPPAAGMHLLDLGAGVEAVLSVPQGRPTARPLLVFCHGAAGTAGQALAGIAGPAADRGIAVLATTAADRTWDLLLGGLGRDVAVLDAALAQVAGRLAVSRTALGGFSDGASYALSLGLANGDLVDAVLAFSPGFAAPPRRTGRPAVFVCHGVHDRVLPVDPCGRRVFRGLRDAGYRVTYEEFDGGHVLPPDLVRGALDWWLAGPPPG